MIACDKPITEVELPPPTSKKTDAVREGDKLSIVVRGQEDLSGDYSVGDEGGFRFPRIGVVAAAGRKPPDIAAEIETRLADGWLRDPQVTVLVTERQNPEEVTVLGGVRLAPEGSPGFNPAFDVTPARLVDAVATDRGVAEPRTGTDLRSFA